MTSREVVTILPRQANYDRLRDLLVFSDLDEEILRYAAVSADDGLYLCQTFDSIEVALDQLGEDVLYGWAPVGVFDLDTGSKTEVNVSVTVTVSEDQGATENELEAAMS